MKEFKFRGVRKDGNGYAYGDLTHQYNRDVLIDGWEVSPETVSQFCGYDAEGNEIYDGDTVIAYGRENTVNLVTFYDLKNCRKKQ